MATVATLDTVMRLNSTAFRQGMVQAASQANASLSAISKKASETASVLLSLKRAAETFGSFYLLKEGLGSLLEAQVQLQAIHYTLIAATGSSSKAADAFGFVRAEADRLGLILPDAAQGFANLSASATAAGVSMKDQQQLFDAYAKSATSLHLSTVQSNRALLALEQMFAKGKIQAQELRLQLGQAIPGAAQRFQNAVMEMTKGTDLAGKSFDQLLEAGALTTSKFLPALVSALQQSGRGWEDASKGLNASLNRVQTAWFNLKTELTNGLFTDAATAGASALANNLSRIAGLVAVIGAGGLAKIGGTALSSGADRVTRLQQEYQGARQAAAAESAYAQRIAATAEAELAAAAAQKQAIAVRQANGAALIAENRELAFNAQAQKEAALALQAKQLGLAEASKSAMVLQVAEERLVAAENQLAAAQARVNAEMALAGPLSDKYAAAQARLVVAQTAATAAATRVTEVRAAEVALGGLGAAAARAAKSFGAFALSLVGGPWGLAVAAIAGLGYAIYDVRKQGEEWRAETENQIKSLKQVTEEAKAAAEGFNTYWDARNHSAGVDAFAEGAKAISKTRGEIADLEGQIRDLQTAMEQRGGGGPLAGMKLDQLQTRLVALQATLPASSAAVNDLGNKVSYGLLPAVDALKGGLDRLRAGSDLKGIWDGLAEGFAKGDKALDDAKAKVTALQQEMQSIATRNEKDLKTRNKTQLQIQQQNLKDIEANIRAQSNLTKAEQEAQLKAAKAGAAPQLKLAAADDAARSAKKTASAINAEAEAYKSLISQINSRLEQDKQAAEATSTLTEAQRLQIKVQEEFKAGKTKLTAADQERVKQLLATAVAQSLVTRATRQQREADKALLDLSGQLAEQAQQQALTNARMLEGIGHGSQWNEQRAGIEAIQDAYRRQRVEADKAYESAKLQQGPSIILDTQHAQALGQITVAEQEAILAQEQFYAAQKAGYADWSAGFQRGIENFMTEQQNNAKQAEQMVSDFTTGFASAFTDFASGAKSASDAFGGMIDDMYKKALAFLANKAIQAFFDSFGMSGKQATPGSSAGGWASIAGNLMNAFGFSAGPGTIGAGLATGGPAAAGSVHPVAEKGPEMLSIGARSYLLMGDKPGRVTPLGEGGSGRSVTNITNINVQPTSTRRTADHIALANARAQRLATMRNG